MPKPQLVAVDTNVLMRLAEGHESTLDAYHMIRRRLRPMQFLLPPTVLGELASKAIDDPDPSVREAAKLAMLQLRARWQIQPVNFNAVQEAIANNAVRLLRDSGLIPYEERNDAAILSEAAILECVLLVSRDSHLLDIEHEKLALLFGRLDLAAPVISSPEKLVKRFYA